MGKKFVVIDGNSLLFRAYHALPALSSSRGQPTGALLGFTEMLLNLLEREQPDAAAIVFDAPGPTFRHEQYEGYKATRPPTPEDLKKQLALAHQIAQAMGLRLYEMPGVEADDVIATLARLGREQDYEVLVVTGDRDLLQIVRPGVSALVTRRGLSDVGLYDAQRVQEEFGVAPEQFAELKGLAGDSSDNLPGAPGVGPKTAGRLIQEFGSVAGIYENLSQVQPPRMADALRQNRQAVEMSVALAKVKDDVQLSHGPAECAWEGMHVCEVRRLLVELEFNKLLRRLPVDESEEASIILASGPDDLASFMSEVRGPVAVTVAELDNRPLGVAFALAGKAIYVPLGRGEQADLFGTVGDSQLQAALAPILADREIKKVGYDLKAAMTSLETVGLWLDGLEFDVALAAYLIAPERGQQTLDVLAAKYVDAHVPVAEVGEPSAASEPMGRRALCIWRLREPLESALRESGADWLFREVEMPLITVLRSMERAGIRVDTARLRQLGQELEQLTSDLSSQIYRIAGHEFNIDSPKQLASVLFEELKLPAQRRTKSSYSTSAAVLERLAEEHEVARLIMEYREYAKLRSTYVDGLLGLVDRQGRVHTTFEQMVTSTGRLSSRNPNLQNIPVRTEWGRRIRACFVPPEDGWALLSADYSQIELRILAHLSRDPALVNAFERGEDVHTRTASLIFGIPPQEVDAAKRRVAKTVNFALIYGQGAVALAQQIGVSREEAEAFIANYFRRLPKVKEYLERALAEAREKKYVETIFGRRRYVHEIASEDGRTRSYAERAAVNAPIQGSAADIIKIAMVHVHDCLAQERLQSRLLLQVHDELLFEAPEEEVEKLASCVREVMEAADEGKLSVPLTVDVKIGPNWRDMEVI
jgi:DNA polymerase-1